AEVKRVQLSSALFFTVIRNHQAAVIVSWAGVQKIYNKYGPYQLDLTFARLNPTILGTAVEFILWGMHHIFVGYDHIAFLLPLLLAAHRLRDMVRVVRSCTLGPRLSLLLAALDLIRL